MAFLVVLSSLKGVYSAPMMDFQGTRGPPSIVSYDCSRPFTVKTFNARSGCQYAPSPIQEPTKLWLLHKITKQVFKGFACKATRNTESHICGYFSYSKALKSSSGHIPYELSADECSCMVRTLHFSDDSVARTKHTIMVPGTTLVEAFTAGAEAISTDGNVMCMGQDVIINVKAMSHVVTSAVYVVRIMEETFNLDLDSNVLYAEEMREVVPCAVAQGNCATMDHTYTWSTHTPHHRCPFVRTRQTTGVMEGDAFNSIEELLLLKVGPQVPATEACGDLQLSRTHIGICLFLLLRAPRSYP